MDTRRAYLVIPKLIEQPTWGGSYIVTHKGWQQKPELNHKKIGQSYELFSASNLSLVTSSIADNFSAEITDTKHVYEPTTPTNSISLKKLIAEAPAEVLGMETVKKFGSTMQLLIKFTQALGNSFQLHIKTGTQNDTWKPKPESWYYFEPGLATLGVKPDIDWQKYEQSMTQLQADIVALGQKVQAGTLTFTQAQTQVKQLVTKTNPWQFVNLVELPKDAIVDLSPCGIHHSWEEDTVKFPLGNVLYELQVDVSDTACTIRNFDKGKLLPDGTTRQLHIPDYFKFIDRSPNTNNPETHLKKPRLISETAVYRVEELFRTHYYSLDIITFKSSGTYSEKITTFRHVFVKTGSCKLTAGTASLEITTGHSVFIPASVKKYSISTSINTVVLLSY
ncbi:TPA: hypothetical protein DIV55_02090 [Patescibacteria group bacterium]|uniref:Mannose-6-phosphate isomerase n=1 Tax=Candidatus Gottesmanbacteria bacterium GW2011_GWA1_43_11 TaxID=1618436 RepID=A0A0G1EMJ5_9BACT|nr:MAG: hypothetical protein UV59_C0023G0010 [Candidatus Gottesmanbacteria bacterium GW2011_GWA1_43_11]HCS78513.1 hypothetical protein [Patescibacteria group bacterium]